MHFPWTIPPLVDAFAQRQWAALLCAAFTEVLMYKHWSFQRLINLFSNEFINSFWSPSSKALQMVSRDTKCASRSEFNGHWARPHQTLGQVWPFPLFAMSSRGNGGERKKRTIDSRSKMDNWRCHSDERGMWLVMPRDHQVAKIDLCIS